MTGLRPTLALTVGDPAGIGPEITRDVLRDDSLRDEADLVVIGPEATRPDGLEDWVRGTRSTGTYFLATDGPSEWAMGKAQESCGRAALAALRAGAQLASSGAVDALVTGPVCKEALHLAGEPVEGQTELLARWAGVERYEMIAIAGRLRVMLLTRHVPLRVALDRIDHDSVVDHLAFFDETLRVLDGSPPKLAVAGVNPHAGEGGILGSEEDELLAPAIEAARGLGIDAHGPRSPDSVFVEARDGRWDGVLAMYHDQAFIPLKLLSEGTGMTLLAGLPYLRLSPVHGTAFDIAGSGRASSANLRAVLSQAARWAMLSR